MTRNGRALAGWSVLLLASACAHVPTKQVQNPDVLLESACRPGKSIQKVSGSVWLKAKSTEAKGQFPAWVKASEPDTLSLEVTNLVGGTEAVITVKNGRYKITAPAKSKGKVREETGYGSWGGIPLNWSTELFLGRIPCPSKNEIQDATTEVRDGKLIVETQPSLKGAGERFVYEFMSWGGSPWPKALHWERKGPGSVSVDFEFEKPEESTRSPTRWEAKSSQGEVKVRWKDRDVSI